MGTSVEHAKPTKPLAIWNKMSGTRAGRLAFSVGVWAKAPYFATALPTVESAEPGQVVITAPIWFGVHNHIGTFHAIAACNLAEAAMGVTMEVTVPSTHRWIPISMHVQYLAKAETGLRATATLKDIDFAEITEGRDVVVSVAVTDHAGKEVVHADITTWVTPS